MSHHKNRGESKMATIPLTSWEQQQAAKKTRKSQLELQNVIRVRKAEFIKPKLKAYID